MLRGTRPRRRERSNGRLYLEHEGVAAGFCLREVAERAEAFLNHALVRRARRHRRTASAPLLPSLLLLLLLSGKELLPEFAAVEEPGRCVLEQPQQKRHGAGLDEGGAAAAARVGVAQLVDEPRRVLRQPLRRAAPPALCSA